MAYEVSNGNWKNVSILDVPGFGSMVNNFETVSVQANFFVSKTEICTIPWANQLNMAIYNKLMSKYSWSKNWEKIINQECSDLKNLWKKYMEDPDNNDFPPEIHNNTLFNFTDFIKDDMQAFLAVYVGSFQTSVGQNHVHVHEKGHMVDIDYGQQGNISGLWLEAGKNVFQETNSVDFVKKNSFYDKLIMDCAFKKPLMTKEADVNGGCGEFSQSLTNNGICHSFNGMEPSKIWKDAEIIRAFNQVFGKYLTKDHNFRGSGSSEGNQSLD